MELNKNKEWVNDNGKKIKWLNNKEGAIIGDYIAFLGNKVFAKHLQKLYFCDETVIIGELVGYGESDNDKDFKDSNYEEFYEFYFKIKKILQKGQDCKWKRNEMIYFNYKNFPIKWEMVDKIN